MLPDLASAPSSSTISVRQKTAAPSSSSGSSTRIGFASWTPAGTWIKHTVAPSRLVAGDEGVVAGRKRAQPLRDQLRMGVDRFSQRQHRRAGGRVDRGADRGWLVGVEVEI